MLSHLDTEKILNRLLDGLAKVVPYQSATIEMSEICQISRGPELSLPADFHKSVLGSSSPLQLDSHTVSAPLRTFKGPLGCLSLSRMSDGPQFKSNELELLHAFAGHASLALENARLYSDVERLATTDELTGLSNRRQVFQLANEEFQRAQRLGHDLSVLMFDIDHFKSFNDRYGHAIGDFVLSQTAGRLKRELRSIDISGRYGGEEFAVVLVGTALEPGVQTADRLRRSICEHQFDSESGKLSVSVSIGIAVRQPDDSLKQVLERADQALYRAKANGRNRVEQETL